MKPREMRFAKDVNPEGVEQRSGPEGGPLPLPVSELLLDSCRRLHAKPIGVNCTFSVMAAGHQGGA